MVEINFERDQKLINNQYFLMYDPQKVYPLTPCINVYKANVQFDGSLEKLKLRIVVRGDLNNKEMIVDIWDPTASIRTLKYFLADDSKHK